MSEPMVKFFNRFEKGSLEGVAAAGFDTRLSWPRWLSGSAATGIAAKLRQSGAKVIEPEASFVVAGKYPLLQPGELMRATAWAGALAAKVESRAPAKAIR